MSSPIVNSIDTTGDVNCPGRRVLTADVPEPLDDPAPGTLFRLGETLGSDETSAYGPMYPPAQTNSLKS